MNTIKETHRTDRTDYPQLMSAKDLQAIGLSRPMVYRLLNREDLPVVIIGRRRLMNRDLFFQWMDKQAAAQ